MEKLFAFAYLQTLGLVVCLVVGGYFFVVVCFVLAVAFVFVVWFCLFFFKVQEEPEF